MRPILVFVLALVSRLSKTDLFAVHRAALLHEMDERLFSAIETLVNKMAKQTGLTGQEKMACVLVDLHMISPAISELVIKSSENLIRLAIELIVSKLKNER